MNSGQAKGRRRRMFFLLCGVLLVLGVWIGCSLWVSHHLRRAESALARYDFPEALEDLQRCLRLRPDKQEIRFLAARTARRASRFDDADEHLSQCERAGATPQTALERLLLRCQQGNIGEIELPLQQLIRDNHADALLVIEALAQGYMQNNRPESALAALGELINRAPDHPWAHHWRGSLRELDSRWSDAIADHRRAVELAPQRREFRLRLARALAHRDLVAEAQPLFEELARETPEDPGVLVGLARCQRILLKPARSIELLDRVLADYPENVEAWMERGRACGDLQEHTEAIRSFRRAVDLSPVNYQVVFALYSALQGQGSDEVKMWEDHLESLKQDEQRLKQISRLLAKEPGNASLRHELGQLYLRFRQELAAVQAFHEALRVDPDHQPSHQALAECYEKLGNADAASFHRQRASNSP